MKRKFFGCLLLVSAAVIISLSVCAESATDTITGYFTETKYVRPEMAVSLSVVESIPAFRIVSLIKVDDSWGRYITESGAVGYVHCGSILPVPDYEPCDPYSAYCKEQQPLRTLPEYGQKAENSMPSGMLFTVDGIYKKFVHISAASGVSGYIPASSVKKAEFRPQSISPVHICVGEEVPATALPLRGAEELFRAYPGTVYCSFEACGDYFVLRTDKGLPAYIPKGNTRRLSAAGGNSNTFFRLPKISGESSGPSPEYAYGKGVAGEDGAVLFRTDGEDISLDPGSYVSVFASYGGFYGVLSRGIFGYIRQDELLVPGSAALTDRLRGEGISGASIRKNVWLDHALPLLEEGNSFLLRYNAATGSGLESLFPLGMPYFWGGRNYKAITARLPDYTVMEDWQSSGGHYIKGHHYVYGFDCIGLVRHVYFRSGLSLARKIGDMASDEYCLSGHHVWCSDRHPLPEDWKEAAAAMEVGDLLLLHYPGTHAMIYIGTLRDYGYTEEQLPALSGALDFPLMIQSGSNPYCYFRFRDMLERRKKEKLFSKAEPPDGGASVCILGLERSDSEMNIEYMEDASSACFEVEGTCITVLSFRNVKDYFIYRNDPAADHIQQ